MVAISSCVTGEKCRYNASDSYNPMLIKDNADNYIAICPEMLADLSIPREPCEIVGGCGSARTFYVNHIAAIKTRPAFLPQLKLIAISVCIHRLSIMTASQFIRKLIHYIRPLRIDLYKLYAEVFYGQMAKTGC